MGKYLRYLIRVRWLEAYRTLQEEWMVLLLFTPLVIGIFLILILRVVDDLSGTMQALSSEDFRLFWGILSGLFLPLSTFYLLRFLILRLYPVQNSDLLFLSLPLPRVVRFHTLLLDLFIRNLPLAAFYLLAFEMRGAAYLPVWQNFFQGSIAWTLLLGSIPLLALGLSIFQSLLAQVLVIFHLLTLPRMLLILVSFGGFGVAGDYFLDIPGDYRFQPLVMIGVILALGYLMAYLLFSRSRHNNLHRVEGFLSGEGKLLQWGVAHLTKWAPRRLCPYLKRDLLLTLRRLSSSFLVYPLLVLCILSGYGYLISTGRTSPYLVYLVCALAVYTLASITVPLFCSTFPYLWVDAAAPVSPEDFYDAKVLYAILITLPIPWVLMGILSVWRIDLPSGEMDPHGAGMAYLLFRLTLLSLFVAAAVAGFLFEGEQRPLLHKIITAMAVILITFTMALHWLFILLMPMLLSYLKGLGLPRLKRIYQEG